MSAGTAAAASDMFSVTANVWWSRHDTDEQRSRKQKRVEKYQPSETKVISPHQTRFVWRNVSFFRQFRLQTLFNSLRGDGHIEKKSISKKKI